MGALAAAVAKERKDVIPTVSKMLRLLKHRGKDGHGIASGDTMITTKKMDEIQLDIKSNVALGHNLTRILRNDVAQPIQDDGMTLVFEGRFFPSEGTSDAKEAMNSIRKNPIDEARCLIRNRDGSYVFAVQRQNQIIAGRDPTGTVPLYYGQNEEISALASERKALWGLGISEPRSFPPGNIAILSNEGISFESAKTLTRLPIKLIQEESAKKHLHACLSESVKERTSGLEKVAIAFSGGLDSSLIASLAKENGKQVYLIAVGLENQPDIYQAEFAAEMMNLPLRIATYTPDDVEAILHKVLWLIEKPSPLEVSVAIPFFWIAETAARLGSRVILAGQGADELFGGYCRYLKDYGKSNETVEKAIFRDTFQAYDANFERDNKICAFHDVELRLPFADFDLISFSLSLPIELKIESPIDPLRKRILREIAKDMDLPPEVYDKPKKAIQYGTGVEKALANLAKNKSQTLHGFIKRSSNEIDWTKEYPFT